MYSKFLLCTYKFNKGIKLCNPRKTSFKKYSIIIITNDAMVMFDLLGIWMMKNDSNTDKA